MCVAFCQWVPHTDIELYGRASFVNVAMTEIHLTTRSNNLTRLSCFSDYNNVVVSGHNELCWSMAVNRLSDYNNVVVSGHNEMCWSMAVNSLSDYNIVVVSGHNEMCWSLAVNRQTQFIVPKTTTFL